MSVIEETQHERSSAFEENEQASGDETQMTTSLKYLVKDERNRQRGCCSYTTRRYISVTYVACLFVSAVIFVVAAEVKTDKDGLRIGHRPVYRYLVVILFISIVWMASFIIFSSKYFQRKYQWKWLDTHIESHVQLVPTRLLIGVMFFGLGSSFISMVELLENIAKYDCPNKDLSMLLYYVVRTVFIYTQLYFLYKLSSHSEKVLIFGHLLMMHLIAVNLGTWIVTFIYDSAEELSANKKAHLSPIKNSTIQFMSDHWDVAMNHTNLTSCLKNVEALENTAKKMQPYLYTFTMEYCLISAGLLLNAWLSLKGNDNGHDEHKNRERRKTSNSHSSLSWDDTGYRSISGERQRKDGHLRGKSKSNIEEEIGSEETWDEIEIPEIMTEQGTLWRFGFILGLVYIPVFTGIVVNLLYSDDEVCDGLIYVGMQFFFFLSVFVASFIGIYEVNNQQQAGETHTNVDFILLAISLVGVFFLDFLIILASICEASEMTKMAIFLIVTNAMEVFASIVFTVFVRKALQHYFVCERSNQDVTKSAARIREVVSFLFVLNICFWGLYTFEVKKSHKVLQIAEEFYTEKVWFYLSHIVYPVAVFFHFHGAVCMVEILNHYSISKTIKSSLSSSSRGMSY